MPTINSISSGIPIEISKGGTNATSFTTSTGIVKYDGTRLVTSSTAEIDSSNRMTNISQPCFLAFLNAGQGYATGDGTVYRIPFSTTVFDQGSSFTTGTSALYKFPITGKYLITYQIRVIPTSAASGYAFSTSLVCTSRTFTNGFGYLNGASLGASYTSSSSVIVDASANDTAYITFLSAGGTKTTNIAGDATIMYTFMSGHLVC